ncbi:Protein CBG27972 [Caenorhabditis briggsae]|uniref:Uncharacterized protein n=2 Tax=Caenorhabditis briggsae TaxID=6238 RepID=A0AAE9CW05_CAEBR|nr:Protein CBG27972 [Caenorhabditis briggsae]ULT83855.1 hypothetical protein L3Y34_012863 [Caenorhabditis briggsae]CAS00144.1 Protein CBG27972 [Caenorhabditis briggsae]
MSKNCEKSKKLKKHTEISKAEKDEQDFDSWLWGQMFYSDCYMRNFEEQKKIYLTYKELKEKGRLEEFKYERAGNSGDLTLLEPEMEKIRIAEEGAKKAEAVEKEKEEAWDSKDRRPWETDKEFRRRIHHPYSDSSASDD